MSTKIKHHPQPCTKDVWQKVQKLFRDEPRSRVVLVTEILEALTHLNGGLKVLTTIPIIKGRWENRLDEFFGGG